MLGDCLEKMKELEENSIDTIITDPPYGLEFMGKDWDKFGVSKARAKRLLGSDNEGSGDKFFDHRDGASKRGRYSEMTVKEKSSFQEFIYQVSVECLRVVKPGGTLLMFGGSRTYHRLACGIEDAGWILKDCIMWLYGSGFPKATDISKQLDKGHKREVIGKSNRHGGGKNFSFFGESLENNPKPDITAPTTPAAKKWNGWKSHGLKPAYEPILVAMKPNDGSYAQNALKWGVSGLNIDGGKIEGNYKWRASDSKIKGEIFKEGSFGDKPHPQGRFPANVILDEEVTDEDWKRFFYCAKASKRERNMGCENMEAKSNEDGSLDGKPTAPKQNVHPTVKPLKLMEYLCRLTKTPTGGVVLDPFMGSGTTGMACKITGRDFIGIEKEEEYFKIAKCRIKATEKELF